MYDVEPFSLYHDVSGVPGCSADNSDSAQSCSGDAQCEDAEICSVAGYCVENTPMQISLTWNDPVDLDLEIRDAEGLALETGSPRGTSATGDRSAEGWLAVWSCGGCDKETPAVGNYGEIALFERIRHGRKYLIRVKNKTDGQNPDKLVAYRLNIFNRTGQLDELFTGQLKATEGAQSVTYQYQPRRTFGSQ